ncbi:putative general amino acid permease [Serendipita vermifera]|nr:putative general amino acid permease [Serendipita vermifera]
MATPLDDDFYKRHQFNSLPSTELGYRDAQGGVDEAIPYENGRAYFHVEDLDCVQRRLGQRHAQMIAIAGTIGTGLLLGSGRALQGAGPVGALLAYAHVGTVAYATLAAVGEMTSFAPVSGTFPHFCSRFVDPALGFAVGWNYFYTNLLTVPNEITAAQIVLTFWDNDSGRQVLYTAILIGATIFVNLFAVRLFGESEFVLSMVKIILIIGLILCGLVIDLGGGPDHDRRGFRYWSNPGPFREYLKPGGTGRFLGILSVLIQASFTYQGVELVAVAAAETESPRRNIGIAVRRVFAKIVTLYMLSVFIIGLTVPSDNKDLLSESGNAAQSPFVIAMKLAGIKGLPHVVNAGVFVSAFSAGNAFLYSASRVLYGLALRGQAPRIFTYCTRSGLPLISVIFCSCFALLSFMSLKSTSLTVFNWFVNLCTTGGYGAWFSINLAYLAFYRAMEVQNIDREQLIYKSRFQPYLSYWGLIWTGIFILINGYDVFFQFNVSKFLTCYINIPLFFSFYFGWKWWYKTEIWRSEDVDFVTGIPTLEETETPEIPPKNTWEKIGRAIL